jgi:hypothetical protein
MAENHYFSFGKNGQSRAQKLCNNWLSIQDSSAVASAWSAYSTPGLEIYHPHLHYIVTGGGLTDEGKWNSSRPDFLLPVKALSLIFRAKLRDQLKKAGLFNQVNEQVWAKAWVVHSEPVGNGRAAFKYLAPYVFRVAIGNNRILTLEDGQVTFKYKESATHQIRFCTLPAEEFIRRFLQHVLPDRFIKVRYYGLLSSGNRQLLNQAREWLGAHGIESNPAERETAEQKLTAVACCPNCGTVLTLIQELKPRTDLPP